MTTRPSPSCLLAFCFSLLLSAEARRHAHSPRHTHHHHHHHISQPPSPAPDPAAHPPYSDGPLGPAPEPAADDPINNSSLSGVFDVRRFGGAGDGVADDTDAFKMAWDAACAWTPPDSSGASASAVVLVPSGYSFMIQSTIFTGPCGQHLVFHLDGTIMPPDGPDSWPQTNSRRQWLVFYRINGMALQGAGLIDGRGHKWWDLPCKPHKGKNGSTNPGPCDSPVAVRFFMSSNLRMEGVRMKNSPQFHLRFDGCENVHVESISITAPALSPNTDGIHIENTNAVNIYNSLVANGDDCVSIGSGCHDVDIRNITCGPGHGISIGSLGKHNSRACVSNITVRESTIRASSNGVRIKTWQGGSGQVRGVSFGSIRMEAVRNPIIIDQFYCLAGEGCANQTSAVVVSDISYTDIRGTYDVRSPAMHFGCSDTAPCTNLTLAGVELLPAVGDIVSDPFCWNAYGDLQSLITIPPLFACLLQPTTPTTLPLQNDHNAFC